MLAVFVHKAQTLETDMYRFLKPVVLSLLATSCLVAAPAQAQSKKDLAAQNAALAERLTRLESRMLTGDPAAERLMARIDSLEASQRALRGELERLTFERDGLTGEVRQLRTELQIIQDMAGRMKIHLDAVDLIAQEQSRPVPRRVGPVSQGPVTPLDPLGGAPVFNQRPLEIGGGTSAPAPAMPSNDISELGQNGKRLLAEGDFTGAQTSLKQYLQFNPDAPDAGEMNFYLGESGKPQDACTTLASLPSQYPDASSAVKDKARLEAARAGC